VSAEAALLGADDSWAAEQFQHERAEHGSTAATVSVASSSHAASDATVQPAAKDCPKQAEAEVEKWWRGWFNAAVKKKEKVAVLEQEEADYLASMDAMDVSCR
jgi:hypothetical protein